MSIPAPLQRARALSLPAGAAGLTFALLGMNASPQIAGAAYLSAWLLFLGISLGSLALLMISYLVYGRWSLFNRRIFEAAALNLPWLALLFVPVLVYLPQLYPWADPAIAAKPVLQAKSLYLNTAFFTARAAAFFAAWSLLALALRRWGLRLEHGETAALDPLRRASGGGLVLYVLTMTFAAIDWVMSLQPAWFSTIFGLIVIAGQVLAALAFTLVLLRGLSRSEPVAGALNATLLHDLGKLLFAAVLFWAYVSFSQFLIIWSGNIAEETPWYVLRGDAWLGLSLLVVVLHFAVPFALLLSKERKRVIGPIARMAWLLLIMRWFELAWLTHPALRPQWMFHWSDFACLLGIGGLWLAAFLRNLDAAPLLPAAAKEAAG